MLGLLKERSAPRPQSSTSSVRAVRKTVEENGHKEKVKREDGVSFLYADLIFELPMLC